MVEIVVSDQSVGKKRKGRAFVTYKEKTRVRLAEATGPDSLALSCQL